ncbi:MAG: IS1595 family transposase [Candidatus Zixiibacteriota bacterium]
MSVLSQPYFHDEAAAVAKLESIVWPEGPTCPHCGAVDRIYDLKGSSTRIGLKKCGHCRKQFTVKVGTVFESSHVPLHKWFQATYLLCSSKKGISAHQLHRVLEVTYKTAWFMAHRLREAMATMGMEPMGGEGAVVEVDETFIGRDKSVKPDHEKKGRGYAHKHKILALVDRKTVRARAMVVDSLKAKDLMPILAENIAQETTVCTDEAGQYVHLGKHFNGHGVVRHGIGEYGRGETHTNTIEGYFSIFKRGMKGVYQHCAKKHLHRYVAEFNFRYNERSLTDTERTTTVLQNVIGKRLTYHIS